MGYRALVIVMLSLVWVVSGCDSGNTDSASHTENQVVEPHTGGASDLSIALTPAQLDWVGEKIFNNECAGQLQCLVHWNPGEAFPSLGIGHFIWYPEGVDERFVESFPALIEYMEQRQLNIPDWLRELDPFDAPWPDRRAFQSSADSPEMAELREFLAGSQGVQAEFIFRRAKESLASVVAAAPESRQADVEHHLQHLSQTPGGVYAIVDYVNFKGEGLSPDERYNGEGWGLLQVLMAMPGLAEATGSDNSANTLAEFRAAAGRVLTRRADNADNPVEQEQWLAGWLRRIDTYREPEEMAPAAGVASAFQR